MFSEEYLKTLTTDWKVITSTVTIVCLYAIYRYITKNDDYFKKRNVAYLKPTLYIGNLLPVFTRKRALSEHITWMYNQFDGHKIAGIFQFMLPMYFVRDPDLIKHMTVKDFDHFVDLPVFVPEDVEPILTKNLQALKGERWKQMRSLLSPAFTSSKLKIIFKLIAEIADQLTSHIEEELKKQQSSIEKKPITDPLDVYVVDVKDLYTKYTNDVIATSAFGVKLNSLQNPNNEFYKMGKSFVTFSLSRFLVFLGYSIFPKIMKFLRIRMIPKNMTDFFRTLIKESIQTREREGIVRPDMIHLLMQVRDENMFETDKSDVDISSSKMSANEDATKTKKMSLGIDDIAAQALVFFSAGFEVVALALSLSTMMLSTNPSIQQKVRDEIDEILAEHDGQITYEAVQKMKLLDNVISETLRLYAPAPQIGRKCIKEYHVPDSDLVIEKDSTIIIPTGGLHHDPKYFPDPENFNPDRFNDDNKHNIKPFTYMPFGSGPRQCIANRFALMETKAALIHLLKRFELHVTSKTKLPLQISKSLQFSFEGGFSVGFKLRKENS